MNNWLARVLGVIILAVIGVFFFDGWFHPKVPPAILEGKKNEEVIALTPEGRKTPAEQKGPSETAQPPQPEISLTSLQDMESDRGAPPVLASPNQSTDSSSNVPETHAPPLTAQSNQSAPTAQNNNIQLESLANAQSNNRAATPPATAPAKPTAAPSAQAQGSTWIQAGSFGEKANADRLAANIRGKSLPAVVEAATVNGKTYHRVYVGPIASNRVSDTLSSLSAMGVNARQINR